MLKGKVAFITGSSRGIGWAIARAFAANGAMVIINGQSDEAQLSAKAEQLQSEYGVEAFPLHGDVTSPDNVTAFYRTIFSRFKRLDVLVNNAGILSDALLGMISEDLLSRVFEVNTLAVVRHTQAACRLMSRNKSGSIINLASIIGTNGNVGQVAYGASKAAVIGLTKSASKELAPMNIRVNAIAPGFINTDMVRQLPEDKFKERMASIKMGRIGEPEDVAGAALFLASDLSSYVTGQIIGVDGGMLI